MGSSFVILLSSDCLLCHQMLPTRSGSLPLPSDASYAIRIPSFAIRCFLRDQDPFLCHQMRSIILEAQPGILLR
jgi:hypothetical protein